MAESRAPVFRRTETLHRARHRNAAPYVFEQCPGYLGHSGAEIRARHSFQERRGERRNLTKLYDVQLTSAELQELLDRWLSTIYSTRKHEGLHGAPPAAIFTESEARGEVRRVADERLLDLLLGEDGVA